MQYRSIALVFIATLTAASATHAADGTLDAHIFDLPELEAPIYLAQADSAPVGETKNEKPALSEHFLKANNWDYQTRAF